MMKLFVLAGMFLSQIVLAQDVSKQELKGKYIRINASSPVALDDLLSSKKYKDDQSLIFYYGGKGFHFEMIDVAASDQGYAVFFQNGKVVSKRTKLTLNEEKPYCVWGTTSTSSKKIPDSVSVVNGQLVVTSEENVHSFELDTYQNMPQMIYRDGKAVLGSGSSDALMISTGEEHLFVCYGDMKTIGQVSQALGDHFKLYARVSRGSYLKFFGERMEELLEEVPQGTDLSHSKKIKLPFVARNEKLVRMELKGLNTGSGFVFSDGDSKESAIGFQNGKQVLIQDLNPNQPYCMVAMEKVVSDVITTQVSSSIEKNSQSQLKLSREEAFNFISYAASSVVLSTGV